MVAQKTSQVPKLLGSHNGSRRMAFTRVMFCLALCLLIGGIAPTMDTEQARLALNSAPIPAPNSAPILAPIAARPVAPAPLAALPGAIADVPADYLAVAAMAALLVLVMVAGLAVVLVWKGTRPASHLGHT